LASTVTVSGETSTTVTTRAPDPSGERAWNCMPFSTFGTPAKFARGTGWTMFGSFWPYPCSGGIVI
jgi:hypothetical protein